jgi:hypothetical protein
MSFLPSACIACSIVLAAAADALLDLHDIAFSPATVHHIQTSFQSCSWFVPYSIRMAYAQRALRRIQASSPSTTHLTIVGRKHTNHTHHEHEYQRRKSHIDALRREKRECVWFVWNATIVVALLFIIPLYAEQIVNYIGTGLAACVRFKPSMFIPFGGLFQKHKPDVDAHSDRCSEAVGMLGTMVVAALLSFAAPFGSLRVLILLTYLAYTMFVYNMFGLFAHAVGAVSLAAQLAALAMIAHRIK